MVFLHCIGCSLVIGKLAPMEDMYRVFERRSICLIVGGIFFNKNIEGILLFAKLYHHHLFTVKQ